MRLIDADAFELLSLPTGSGERFSRGAQYVLEKIDEQPTIDAVPVIRCKDCRYRISGGLGYGYCTQKGKGTEIYSMVYDCDFCSHGERARD